VRRTSQPVTTLINPATFVAAWSRFSPSWRQSVKRRTPRIKRSSEIILMLAGKTAGKQRVHARVAGLRAIIWLLGGVRGGPACCHAEEGSGVTATSCGGPYKRVNSVLLAVNILRLRRSAEPFVLALVASPLPSSSASLSLSLSFSLASTIDATRNSVHGTPRVYTRTCVCVRANSRCRSGDVTLVVFEGRLRINYINTTPR